MGLRMHPVSEAGWQRLAATRGTHDAEPPMIDLVALEAETDPCRRVRAEVALIQAYVHALEAPRVAH